MSISYTIYANDGSGAPVDYSTPLSTTSALTFTTAALAHPGDWRFAVRATDGTLEESNIDAVVRLVLDSAGVDVTNLPAAPVGLTARPIAGGSIRVTWADPGRSKAAGFHVYAGATTPDYGTAVATAAANASGRYQADLAGLTDGTTYAIGVRAYNAAGEEANTTTASATATATGPAAVDGLTISTDPADW